MATKKLGIFSSATIIIAGLTVAVIFIARHPQLMSQTKVSAAQSTTGPTQNGTSAAHPGSGSSAAAAISATASAVPAEPLPPGTITHEAKALTTATFLARQHLTESKYMTVADYVAAIAQANDGKTSFKKGEDGLHPGD